MVSRYSYVNLDRQERLAVVRKSLIRYSFRFHGDVGLLPS